MARRHAPAAPEPYRYLPGDGPPLLLLHGLGGTWQVWEPLLPALAASCSVLAATLPGHWGGIPALAHGSFTVESAADDIEVLLDRLGVDTAHVAGHSMGAGVALELARRRRARSVSVLCPGIAWPGVACRLRLLHRLALCRLVARTVARRAEIPYSSRLVDRWVFHFAAWQRGQPIQPEGLVLLQGVAHCPAFIRIALMLGATTGIRPLPTRTCPVQLIWTDNDQMFPPERFRGALLDRVVPDTETTISGCGHMLLSEKPDRVAALILEHLHTTERQPGRHDDE